MVVALTPHAMAAHGSLSLKEEPSPPPLDRLAPAYVLGEAVEAPSSKQHRSHFDNHDVHVVSTTRTPSEGEQRLGEPFASHSLSDIGSALMQIRAVTRVDASDPNQRSKTAIRRQKCNAPERRLTRASRWNRRA
jgi:hypothetical protein